MPLGNMPLTNTIVDTLSERNIATRTGQLGCLQPPNALRSDENENGGPINFLTDKVLGLSNPMEFEVTADSWQVHTSNFGCVTPGYVPANTRIMLEHLSGGVSMKRRGKRRREKRRGEKEKEEKKRGRKKEGEKKGGEKKDEEKKDAPPGIEPRILRMRHI